MLRANVKNEAVLVPSAEIKGCQEIEKQRKGESLALLSIFKIGSPSSSFFLPLLKEGRILYLT